MANLNRRHFLHSLSALSFAGATSALSIPMSARAMTGGYKALVAIEFSGGLDHADTLIAYDTDAHARLAAARPNIFAAHGGSRSRERLLPLDPVNSAQMGGREYALPEELEELHTLFGAGDLSIISSIGPLIEPVTRADMESGRAALPPRLHSHNDQQSTWRSFGVEGTPYGWGGLFADRIMAQTAGDPIFATVSAHGGAQFLAGRQARTFATSDTGAPTARFLQRGTRPGQFAGIGSAPGDDAARTVMRRFFERTEIAQTNLFQRDSVLGQARAIPSSERFETALAGASALTTAFPDTGLGKQLFAVIRALQIRGELDNTRQIFSVRIGGFDTHNGQAGLIAQLHREIGPALSAFAAALKEIGLWDDVTTFTMSDFGRTVVDNGDGTDHGWGGHQFVMGGAVRGGHIFGQPPGMDLDGPDYTRFRGRLIPTTAVEQLAASLGSWYGLGETDLNAVLPNLSNFDRSLDLFA